MSKKKDLKDKDPTDYSDIADEIQPVEELPDFISMVVYGRSGTGKTTFGGTFPKPTLLLDVKEKGTDSIKDVDGIKVINVNDWREFQQIYWFLRKADHNFKSVVIDTITQIQDFCKEESLILEGKDPDAQPSINDWGTISGLMKQWVLQYRDLPMHVLYIAQSRTDEVDTPAGDQLDPEIGPNLIPSAAETLCAAVKVIGQTYIAEKRKPGEGGVKKIVQYRMRLGPHPYYTTKIRQPKSAEIPESINNPTFKKVKLIMDGKWEQIKEKMKKKKRRKKSKSN